MWNRKAFPLGGNRLCTPEGGRVCSRGAPRTLAGAERTVGHWSEASQPAGLTVGSETLGGPFCGGVYKFKTIPRFYVPFHLHSLKSTLRIFQRLCVMTSLLLCLMAYGLVDSGV